MSHLQQQGWKCFFYTVFGSDLSKMDQTWSNWISHQSKNVIIKSFHIYLEDKNGNFLFDCFGSDLSKMDQIDETWWNCKTHQLKMLF